MKFTSNFVKTKRHISADIESTNGKLLTRAGYIHMEVAGVYSYLPLGLKVLDKIENIVRKHMDTVGSEVRMSNLSPTSFWQTTNRIDSIDVLMKAQAASALAKAKNSTEYILACTHEDIITPLVQDFTFSYKDLPISIYQIGTKFRNEPRAKGGLLRGREFRMKDLYSFHVSQADFQRFYESMKPVYLAVYKELGIGEKIFITLASGGDFTSDYSHEFQVLLDTGEDTIYLDRQNQIAYNKEIITPEDSKKLGVDFSSLEVVKASEVGNIFPLSTRFPDAFNFTYTDEHNQQQKIWMGSYGIGTTRLLGVMAEIFSDSNGLCWPENIAPFGYHLITDNTYNNSDEAQRLYSKYQGNILWDNRPDIQVGQKMIDADLIGCPTRLILSDRSFKNGGVEKKSRTSSQTEIISL